MVVQRKTRIDAISMEDEKTKINMEECIHCGKDLGRA